MKTDIEIRRLLQHQCASPVSLRSTQWKSWSAPFVAENVLKNAGTSAVLYFYDAELVRALRQVCRGCEIINSRFEREDLFAGREVARLDHGEAPSSLFEVPFQLGFLLHEFIIVISCSGTPQLFG